MLTSLISSANIIRNIGFVHRISVRNIFILFFLNNKICVKYRKTANLKQIITQCFGQKSFVNLRLKLFAMYARVGRRTTKLSGRSGVFLVVENPEACKHRLTVVRPEAEPEAMRDC